MRPLPAQMLTHLTSAATRAPWLTLGAVLMVTLALGRSIPRIEPELNGHALIPEGHEGIRSAQTAAAGFDARDKILVGVSHHRSIFTPEGLTALRDLSEAIAGVEGIEPGSVVSLATLPRTRLVDDHLDFRPLLTRVDDIDEAVTRQLLDDTLYSGRDDGLLLSEDRRTAGIVAEVSASADPFAIERALSEIRNGPRPAGITVEVTGSILAQAVLGDGVARDLAVLVPFSLTLLALLLFFYYRHWLPAMVTLLEIGVTLIWTLGLMGWTGEPIFITTLVLPIMLISIGVSDDIYALNAALAKVKGPDDREYRQKVVAGFASVATPISMTATTTVIGLLSLVLTRLESFRVFGLFSAVSILFSTLFTFTLLPALLMICRRRLAGWRPTLHRALTSRMVHAIRAFRGKNLEGAAWCGAGLLIASCFGATLIEVDDSWLANLPADSDLVADSARLDETMAGTTLVELVVDSGARDGFTEPGNLAVLGELESTLAALPAVGTVQGPFTAISRLQAALEPMAYEDYRAVLDHGGLLLDHGRIYQSLMMLGSMDHAGIDTGLSTDYQRARLSVFIRDADYRTIDHILTTANRGLAEPGARHMHASAFGDGWISYLTVQILVDDQISSLAWAFVADFVFLLLVWRSVSWSLVVLLPVVTSILVVFSILGLSGFDLGIASSMFAAIAIGIGVDFSIHLVAEVRRTRELGLEPSMACTRAVRKTGPAILASAVVVSGGFAVLLLSRVSPNASLGLLIGMTLLLSAVLTLMTAPLLGWWLRWRERRVASPAPVLPRSSREPASVEVAHAKDWALDSTEQRVGR